MWWATRLTFNSPRVLRHMTRLLFLSGDASLGKRTLKVYAQAIGKAWQTHGAQMCEETDTNENWVELLVFGVRMLCKAAASAPGTEGMKDARDAGELVEKARMRLDKDDKRLTAHVDMIEGLWNTVMALKGKCTVSVAQVSSNPSAHFSEQDPFTRSQRLEKSYNLFSSSVEGYPTALGYFYLALSLARAGALQDLQQATVYAGQAVEDNSSEVRYWHLLGILLTATEQWKAAAEILERGAALDDVEAPESVDLSPESDRNHHLGIPVWENTYHPPKVGEADSFVASTARPDDLSPTPTQPYRDEAYVLERNFQQMPPSSDLLGSIVDQCWPLSFEIVENSLQLRLTQVYLAEAVDGAEAAEQKWIEVFRWISAKKATIGDSKYPKTDLTLI